jgi:hypothetical protein
VVVVPGADAGAERAYVSLFGANAIAVVDLSTGTVTGTIDLGAFVDPSDQDGSVEVDSGMYDPVSGRAYFVLQRIDLTTVQAPDYQLRCSAVPGLLVALDPTTDTVVSADDAGAGTPLSLAAPTTLAFDQAKREVLLAANGCFETADGGAQLVRHGIESVDLMSGSASVPFSPATGDVANRFLILDAARGVLQGLDDFYSAHYYSWDRENDTLGAELSGVPEAPVAETPSTLIGLRSATVDGGSRVDVVRYRVSTGASSVVIEGPFQDGLPYAVGVALVRAP